MVLRRNRLSGAVGLTVDEFEAGDQLGVDADHLVPFSGHPRAEQIQEAAGFVGVPDQMGSAGDDLDSAQARTWWHHYLNRLPYPWWRPLVHTTYYGRLALTMRAHNGPVVLHDCATHAWNRRLIMNAARSSQKQVHLLLLEVAPPIARAAQHARGRAVPATSFLRHCQRWQHLRDAALDDPGAIHPDIASTVIINRAGAQQLAAIHFEESP